LSSRRIVLVRHALSAVDPDVDSRKWGIADGADGDCLRLADALPARPAVVYASAERKAVDTAEAVAARVGAELRTDERFGEVRRPYVDGDYRTVALAYLRADHDGWEPRTEVMARFSRALDDALATTSGDVLVVDHGLAMSLYVASVTDVDVVSFWSGLTFPDAWSLDPASRTAERLFDGGRPAPDV